MMENSKNDNDFHENLWLQIISIQKQKRNYLTIEILYLSSRQLIFQLIIFASCQIRSTNEGEKTREEFSNEICNALR